MTAIVVETERLLLRKPRAEDAADLAVAYADPKTVRYIGDGSTSPRDEVEQGIARWRERWDANGLGLCSLERREDGRVLGRAGYAAAAALALRDRAFAERGLTRLISLIRPGNEPSIRVAERIGERYEREVVMRGLPALVYALDAA